MRVVRCAVDARVPLAWVPRSAWLNCEMAPSLCEVVISDALVLEFPAVEPWASFPVESIEFHRLRDRGDVPARLVGLMIVLARGERR